jgi:aspartate 1-decarboxylase
MRDAHCALCWTETFGRLERPEAWRIAHRANRIALYSAMRRTLCKSKIHRATITGADLNYEGSLTLDRALMDAADMLPYERVQVVNVNNGARLETYLIPGDAGSGVVQLNGAGARLGAPGDVVILMTYAEFEDDEIDDPFTPRVVLVDDQNRIRPAGD